MKPADLIKGEKFNKYIILAGIIGIVLLFFSSVFDRQGQKEVYVMDSDDKEYVEQMEKKLEELVSMTQGAGRSKIMITLENGVEYRYATEERNSSDLAQDFEDKENKSIQKRDSKENNYIIIDGKNGKEALVERKIQPKIRGVAVLCDGGDNPVIKNEIIQIVTTVFDIPSTKISVNKLKFDK